MSERWQADEAEMHARRRLTDYVDNELKRREQETGMDFFRTDDQLTITTYVPTIVKGLLQHDFANIRWVYVEAVGGSGGRMVDVVSLADSEGLRRIEGIQASLPIGALSIKGEPRKRDTPSGIVSTPADAEAARESFAGGDM